MRRCRRSWSTTCSTCRESFPARRASRFSPPTSARCSPTRSSHFSPRPLHDAPPARDLPKLTDVRVMLVDDDTETREVLTMFLNKSGAQVVAAESSAQGVALLEAQPPDVIIADIGMPAEDGYTFIRNVRSRSTGGERQPPAIAL